MLTYRSYPVRPLIAAAAACGLLFVAACSSEDGTAVSAQDSATAETDSATDSPTSTTPGGTECGAPTTPLLAMDREGLEPVVETPAPDGWERFGDQETDVVRIAAANPGMSSDQFATNYTVTLEDMTGRVDSDEEAIEAQWAGFDQAGLGSITDRQPSSVCGFTAERGSVTIDAQGAAPDRAGDVLVVAVPSGADLYAVSVIVQTTTPDEAEYGEVVNTIFDGVQISTP